MNNFYSLLEIYRVSQYLIRINKEFYTNISRFYAYLFSPRIRNVVFSIDWSDERIVLVDRITEKVNLLIKHADILLNEKNTYYRHIEKNSEMLSQKEHELSKRFVFNSILNSQRILNALREVEKDLQTVQMLGDFEHMKELFHKIKRAIKNVLELSKEDEVLLSDIRGRLQIRDELENKIKELEFRYEEIEKHLLDQSQLKTGDILLSFKSKELLKKMGLARRISELTDSQVTHAAVCVRIDRIDQSDSSKSTVDVRVVDVRFPLSLRYRLRNIDIRIGEALIVIRPRMSNEQRASLVRAIRIFLQKKPKFSIIKLAGVAPTYLLTKFLNQFTREYVNVPNIAGGLERRGLLNPRGLSEAKSAVESKPINYAAS